MDATRRTWRREAVRNPGGTSWRLVAGRGDDRARLNLGPVAEDVAEACRAPMQAEEDDGTAHRVLERYARNPAGAVRYLLRDPGEVALMGPARPEYKRMPLRDYVATVFEAARSAARPKSWRTEGPMWKRINADLGDVRLGDLDARVFYRWVRDLQVGPTGGVRRGKPRPGTEAEAKPLRPASGQYKTHMRGTLQACLTYAYIEGHLEHEVRLGTLRIEGATGRSRVKPDPLTIEELGKLLDASEPKHRAMWATAAGEGLRPSELRRLRWEDVRWADRTLSLRGDDEGKGKTALSVDVIPLTPLAFRELRAWWLASGQPTTGIMFASGKLDEDGRPLPYTSISGYRRSLEAARKGAKIGRQVNPYLLRDSFATICWSIGVDRDTCRRILRHADEAMLDRIYCRPRPADLVARVAAFDLVAG